MRVDHPLRELRCQYESPGCGIHHRGHDRVGRDILQEVAGRAGLDGVDDLDVPIEGGEDDDGRRRIELAQAGSGLHPVEPVAEAQVAQDHVGARVGGERERLFARGRFAHDLDVGAIVEQRAQPGPHDRMVVDDQQSHRHVSPPLRRAAAHVRTAPCRPPAHSRRRVHRRVRAAALSSRGARTPRIGEVSGSEPMSKPTPSSTTSMRTPCPQALRLTTTRVALECRRTFASADCAVRSRATSTGVGSTGKSSSTCSRAAMPVSSANRASSRRSAPGRACSSSSAGASSATIRRTSAQTLLRQSLDAAERAIEVGWRAARPREEQDRRELLSDGVVDVATQPSSFADRARLALCRGELVVQLRRLGLCGHERGDEALALARLARERDVASREAEREQSADERTDARRPRSATARAAPAPGPRPRRPRRRRRPRSSRAGGSPRAATVRRPARRTRPTPRASAAHTAARPRSHHTATIGRRGELALAARSPPPRRTRPAKTTDDDRPRRRPVLPRSWRAGLRRPAAPP